MDWLIGALVDGGVRLTVTIMVHIAYNLSFCISSAGFGQVMAMMVMMATCPRVDWSNDPLRTGTRGNMSIEHGHAEEGSEHLIVMKMMME